MVLKGVFHVLVNELYTVMDLPLASRQVLAAQLVGIYKQKGEWLEAEYWAKQGELVDEEVQKRVASLSARDIAGVSASDDVDSIGKP